ncbi:MAG: uracil-DNA glycosylase [Gammaproteobacteria bacterium]|jgi:uracil-DNA glycosylase|nr:uracil-DNA glycosylase [Gammaproteobacteria bacterium]MBU0773401.1 uracil-DNA glycosylase [Gammaproteobacteria bacterium]MBU0857395.1 uracil-DNA glycosylase [Gammaproteobacteria bacterium]MBU1846858.1 uracil-DNA glycosylase [Gammaproteobacteria bacterium]
MGLAPLWRLRAQDAMDTVLTEATQPAVPVGGEVVQSPPQVRAERAPSRGDAQVLPVSAAPAVMADGMDWDTLEAAIRGCQACALHEKRRQAVPGVGDRQADWLFVGEGPGAEEDQRGEPFVGPAGKLLDAMLAAIGLARGRDVYIANAVKCRPPGNRTPEAGEISTCHPFLERQIELLQPRIIVALGRPAAQTLLGGEVKIGAARGRRFDRNGVPVVVTYHPAYLLRNPQDKAKAWEDLCFARDSIV